MKNTAITFLLLLGLFAPLFAQTDNEPPTIVCKQNVVHLPIAPPGTVTIFADHALYDTLYDNVSSNIDLRIRKLCTGIGFPQNGIKATYNYSGQFAVEVWARDQAGNKASCITHISLDEGGNTNHKLLDISLRSETSDGVSKTPVELRADLCGYESYVYQYDHLSVPAPEPGSSFTLRPFKDDNPLNGVTTYDMVLIAKHIMGLEPLGTPYKMIAADANYDGKITTLDIILLRRVILGISQNMPQEESWRFVPRDYVFPNPQNPFVPQFPTEIYVPFVSEPPELSYKFLAIKIGDVNNTAVANNKPGPH